MPIYTFRNLETDEIFEEQMTMSERELYLQDNKGLIEQLLIKPPLIGDPVRLGVTKPPSWITNKIRSMEKNVHGNVLSKRKTSHNVTEI